MELEKLAALAIRELISENKELEKKLEIREEAVKLAFYLVNEGMISNETLQSNIEEFSNKSLQDLKMIKQSAEFSKTANFSSFKISQDEKYEIALDAETQFINFLLD